MDLTFKANGFLWEIVFKGHLLDMTLLLFFLEVSLEIELTCIFSKCVCRDLNLIIMLVISYKLQNIHVLIFFKHYI